MLLYAMPRCWAPHTQHKCTVYGDDECLSECLSLSLSLCLSVSHSLCVIDNDDDEKMVSYTTRHVYYAMPRCLGPSHFFFFKVNPLIPPHAIRERAATDACTTRLRRLKHAATKDKRAGPTRAAACVRRSPLRPCPRSQSFQSPELHGGRVFSAECIPAFDWQSVGLFYSFYHSKQPGRITRLLACEDEQLRVRARRSCAQAEPTLRPSPRPSPRLARPRCTRR